jgi:hypothetical protein
MPAREALPESENMQSILNNWHSPGRNGSLRIACVAFLLVFCVVVVEMLSMNLSSVFSRSVVEQGDISANALAIRDAKALSRITGNYSRYGFDHPGPFFLYVYAAGEYLFFDALGIVPSPHNAHVISGLLVQAAFFALAIASIAYWTRSLLSVPIALLLCLIYLATLNSAEAPDQFRGSVFMSIWAPHWVMFPTLAFLATCSSLAAGHCLFLPFALLCGSVVVHGYINTPIYIVPTFLFAYVAFHYSNWSASRQSLFPRLVSNWREHALATAILGVFVAPIILDAIRGEQSNAHKVFVVLGEKSGSFHEFSDAFSYVLNFFTFLNHGAAQLNEIEGSAWEYLTSQWDMLVFWLLVVVLAFSLARFSRRKVNGIQAFQIYSAIIICLIWTTAAIYSATTMIGPLHFYVSYHFFAVPLFLLLVLASSMTYLLPPSARSSHTVFLLLSLGVLSLPAIPAFRESMSGYGWRLDRRELLSPVKALPGVVEAALLASTDRPGHIVLDLYDYSEEGQPRGLEWPIFWLGPPIGVLLERQGIPFLAHTNHPEVFGRNRILNDVSSLRPDSVVWRFVSRDSAGPEAIPIDSKTSLTVSRAGGVQGL